MFKLFICELCFKKLRLILNFPVLIPDFLIYSFRHCVHMLLFIVCVEKVSFEIFFWDNRLQIRCLFLLLSCWFMCCNIMNIYRYLHKQAAADLGMETLHRLSTKVEIQSIVSASSLFQYWKKWIFVSIHIVLNISTRWILMFILTQSHVSSPQWHIVIVIVWHNIWYIVQLDTKSHSSSSSPIKELAITIP